MDPSYGHSSHYTGEKGELYFEWQNASGEINGRINSRKFSNYVKESDSVLDFGCGAGYLLKSLQCKRRIGVEINPLARDVAIKNGIECHGDFGDIEDSFVDVVVSNHALEHVPFPIQALKEIYRALKPSGLLVLVVPYDDWRNQKSFTLEDVNHHLYTWSPLLMGNCLVEAGFDPGSFDIHMLTRAWMPGYQKIYGKAPGAVFEGLCYLYSVLRRRRQVIAIARKPS